MGYIYLIENNINKKKYIGQTIQDDVNKRWNKHRQVNKSYIGTCLFNAYKKYSIENFTFKIICICFDSDIDKFEQEYINKYNTLYPNGYNMIEGGKSRKFTQILKQLISNKLKGENHPMFGKHLKEETKQKLREKNIGINGPNYGKKLSKEQKEHLSKLAIERHKNDCCIQYEKTKQKISNSIKNYYNNETITNKNNIKVQQYDLSGNLIKTHISMNEAAKEIGVAQISISRASNPNNTKYPTCKGFIWKRI
jgi:group I intron endonuclease